MIHFKDFESRLIYQRSIYFLVFFFLLLPSCATLQSGYHKFLMKGSIIETQDSTVYLCIGEKDGAVVGQELDVYKIIVRSSGTSKLPPIFKKDLTGRIKITRIFDEHFAEATIISGKAETNYIVELSAP